jgi:hypothetical protein
VIILNDIDTMLEAVEDKVYERGRMYYESGMIQELIQDTNGNFSAKVAGNELTPYRVQVSVNPQNGEVLSYRCSCPYEFGDICKHLVAVLLAIQNRDHENKPVSPADELSQAIEALSTEQLQDLVLTHAQTDSAFYNEVLLASKILNNSQILSGIKDQIREAIRSGTHRGCIDWRGCDEICEELYRLLDIAQDQMKHQRLVLTFEIVLEIIRAGIQLASTADSSSGSLASVLCGARELLEACCNAIADSGTEKEQKQCLDRLIKVSQEKRFDGWDNDAYALLHTAVCFLKKKDSVKWYATLDAMQKKAEANDYSDYSLEENALVRLESIEKLDGKAAAKEYLYANLKWDNLCRIAVEWAIEEKDYPEAERLCQEKLSSEEQYNRSGWLEYLYQIYSFLHDSKKQAKTAESLLLGGDLNYFDRLKELQIADGTWEKEYPNLLNNCKAKLPIWQYQQLLEHTGEYQLLLDSVKINPTSIFKYGSVLAFRFSGEVFQIYDAQIRKSAEIANSRPQYKKVCSQIKELYQAGGSETAMRLISMLIETYPRRTAFLDEISKLRKKFH